MAKYDPIYPKQVKIQYKDYPVVQITSLISAVNKTFIYNDGTKAVDVVITSTGFSDMIFDNNSNRLIST